MLEAPPRAVCGSACGRRRADDTVTGDAQQLGAQPIIRRGQRDAVYMSLLELVHELLNCLGEGQLSVKRIHRLATAILMSTTACPPGLYELAQLHPHHLERGLQRWTTRQAWCSLLPSTYEFVLPVRRGERVSSALLPHEVLASLYKFPELFEFLFTGGPSNLQAWWDNAAVAGGSWYAEHPVIADTPHMCIPLGMHGDDAGMHGHESTLIVTWNSLAVKHATLDSRIVFSMLRVADIDKRAQKTLQVLYRVLSWSFNALASGRHPYADHLGQPFSSHHHPRRFELAGQLLAGGMRGAWGELRGDWKYLRETLYLQKYYNTPECCHLCDATKQGYMRYSNFRSDAPHRETLTSHMAWSKRCAALAVVSPLLGISGFNIWRVQFDIMHVLDLGVLQVAVPSAMWELTDNCRVWAGASRQDRFDAAYAEYTAWCVRGKIQARVKRSKKASWKSPGEYPAITQQTAKAAALRSMMYWVSEVCDRVINDDGEHGAMRAAVFLYLVKADGVCRSAGRFLTPMQREALRASTENALLAYNALADDAISEGRLLWKMLPKHHALQHIGADSAVNPRIAQCYSDEDMVGRCKRIYVRCHASSAPRAALLRYVALVGTRWWDKLRVLRGLPEIYVM